MSILTVIGLVMAAYTLGCTHQRVRQVVRDVQSVIEFVKTQK